jgi:chromosome segregation ATPase
MQRTLRNFLLVPLAFAFQAALLGQPAAASQQSPHPAQSSQDQSPSQAQTPAQDKQDSVAEAARKAKEKKAAAAKHKVLTEDDLSGMTGGVSVVGTEGKKTPNLASNKNKEEEDAPNGEKYWRGKARPILGEMADIEQLIVQLKEEIKKYGNGGFDVTTGFKNDVAYVEDRNAQIEKLQKKKADLQKQLADLEEEGRKAGAQPAWFR